MAQCPNCGATLKEDYGMSQCTQCGLFSFIDMEGNAVISPSGDDASSASSGAAPVLEFPPLPTSTSIPAPPPMEDALMEDAPMDVEIVELEPDLAPPENPGEENFEPFSFDPAPNANPEENAIPDLGPADDPLGLAEFANSEISSAKDGPLLFRILVSGIDSKEMRETIREVLEDPRFGWDVDQMFARLEKGVLTIENLSPVKASILVTRIKRLPVKIRWEQYAVSQVDPSP